MWLHSPSFEVCRRQDTIILSRDYIELSFIALYSGVINWRINFEMLDYDYYYTRVTDYISTTSCKTRVTPLLTYWSYCIDMTPGVTTSRTAMIITVCNVDFIFFIASEYCNNKPSLESRNDVICEYRRTSGISHTKLKKNVARLVLQLIFPNPLKPCVKSWMKM